MKPSEITPKKIKQLYETKKISSPKIAKIYNCTPEYIRHLLRKYKIRIRTKSGARKLLFNISIPKEKLRTLYLKEKLPSSEIAKKFDCSPSLIIKKLREYYIPVRTIKETRSLLKPRSPQKDFSKNPKEKAYLIGLRIGDLHVYSTSETSPTIFVHTNSTQLEFIRLFENLFSPYNKARKTGPDKKNAISIRCSLNRSFNFLLNKEDLIEPWILKNKEYFASFLAGYIDAEGSFCLCVGNAVFSIKSQDKNVLSQIRKKLIELKILLRPSQLARKKGTRDSKNIVSNKDVYTIYIYRKDSLLNLIKLINPYLKYTKRRRDMKIVENNIILRNKKYNCRQDVKWFREYLKEGIAI